MPVNSFENYPMSWKPRLIRGEKPIYLLLAEQLEQDIQNGILLPGTKLPPQRELADFLDLNVSTVARAFKICSNKGLLCGTVGRGTFVSYAVNTSTLPLPDLSDTKKIELGSMMPETIPQEEAVRLLQEMLTEESCKNYFQYGYPSAFYHKKAAAQVFERLGLSVRAAEQILFAAGGQNALAAVFGGLFQAGDRIGVDPLVYPGVKGAANFFGIRLVPLKQENGELTAESIVASYKKEGIRGIYVMPDLQNPTNHTMSLSCRKKLRKRQKHWIFLYWKMALTAYCQQHISRRLRLSLRNIRFLW